MDVPITQFTETSDGVRIAYQDFGEGPPVVFCAELLSNQELQWDGRENQRVLEHIARHVRFVTFDIRGVGLSDRFDDPPTTEQRLEDINAAMAAAGLESASIYGMGTGGRLAVHFAAQFPDRVTRLVLDSMGGGPALRERAAELGHMSAAESLEDNRQAFADMLELWGVDARPWISIALPSRIGDEDLATHFSRWLRMTATATVATRQMETFRDFDIADVLPAVEAPTLLIHTVDNRLNPVGNARAVAELLPNATLREFPGADNQWWYAPYWRDMLDVALAFLTDSEIAAAAQRRFAAVLFTDIVNSTRLGAELGDRAWAERIEAHDRIAETVVTEADGTIVKNTGDGLLAAFSSPTNALNAAARLRSRLGDIGLEIRAGIHGGDIEHRGEDISGAVVNLAARVEQSAATGQIYMTTAMREMVLGSGHAIESVGAQTLKGFEGSFELHRLLG